MFNRLRVYLPQRVGFCRIRRLNQSSIGRNHVKWYSMIYLATCCHGNKQNIQHLTYYEMDWAGKQFYSTGTNSHVSVYMRFYICPQISKWIIHESWWKKYFLSDWYLRVWDICCKSMSSRFKCGFLRGLGGEMHSTEKTTFVFWLFLNYEVITGEQALPCLMQPILSPRVWIVC